MPRKKKKAKTKIIIPPEIQPYYEKALVLGLTDQTFRVLLENGYNNISTISSIEESDLQVLDIPLAQKSVLRRLVKDLQTESLKRSQPESTTFVNYKSCTKQVRHVDQRFSFSSEIYESSESTLVPTSVDNQSYKELSTEVKSNVEDRFRPEIVIISTDDEDDCFGVVKKIDEENCLGYANRNDQVKCTDTKTNDENYCLPTSDRDEDVNCTESLKTAHTEARQDSTRSQTLKTDTLFSFDHKSNIDNDVNDREQLLSEHEESSSDSEVVEASYDGSSSSYGESDSDIERDKGSKPKSIALSLKTRAGYRPQKTHGKLAKKQYSGYEMQLPRKSKSIQSKNTYVHGASGCIIGDNVNITHNETKEDVDILARKLEEQTRKALKSYEEEDVFIVTEAYKKIKDELESSYFITVTGRPGDGKTTIAIRLLIDYSKQQKKTCFIVQTAEHWDLIAGLKGREVIIMIDDVFGTYVYDEMKAKPWISRFEIMEKIINGGKGDILVIFTSRFYIIQDVKHYLDKFSLFKSQYIINLSDKEFELSALEKKKILEQHLLYNKLQLDEETREEVSYISTPHGFPHCAKLFTTSYFLYQQGLSFFKQPIKCLNSEIEKFRLSDKNKFCVLALMAMRDKGKLTESFLNDIQPKNEETKTLIRICGLPDNTPFSVLKDALICMLSVYVRKTPDGSYVFHHETISEAVCYSLLKSNPEFALRDMDLKFINKRIKTQAWKHGRDVLVLCIPQGIYLPLWRRLYKEISKGNVRLSMKHQAWEDQEFIRLWPFVKSENDVKDKRFLIELVQLTDKNYLNSVFYWAVFYKKEAFIETVLQIDSVKLEELSQAFVTACIKGISISILQKMIEKKANLEYIDTACQYTKNLRKVNNEYDTDESAYGDVSDFLYSLFGEKMASVFLNGGFTPLQGAIFSKNMEIVKFLLKSGSKITTRQKSGKTALHFASAAKAFDIQKYLLDFLSLGPSYIKHQLINCTDRLGRTPLHFAKSEDMIILLIQHQADPNIRDIYGHTPLLYRAKFGINKDVIEALCKDGNTDINAVDNVKRNVLHILLRSEMSDDIVKCLFRMAELGVNFNCRTCEGETPLMAFAKTYAHPTECDPCLMAKVVQTLEECGTDFNAVDSKGKTALHYSIDCENQEKALYLLLHGANPIVASLHGCPLFYLMIHYSRLENSLDANGILNTMIKYMSDINFCNKQGKNFLHLILQEKHTSPRWKKLLIDILLQRGIDGNVKDINGVTPVMMAASTSCEILKLFKENHGVMNAADNGGKNALFYVKCTERLDTDIVNYLLEQGLSLNDCDKNNNTPLHDLLSSEHCTVECVKFYISKGADIIIRDISGKNVFHHLFSKKGIATDSDGLCKIDKICETLSEHGADINSVDNEGNTPLIHSCKNKNDIILLKYLFSRKDVKKNITNKEGQNILHLIINAAHIRETDKLTLIEMLQEQEFDFNVIDCFAKSAIVYAIENNFLSITLKLLSITNVFDDDKTLVTVWRSVIESDLLNRLLEKNSSYSRQISTPEQIYSVLSGEHISILMRLFTKPKSIVMQNGTLIPHFLIKSRVNDDVLNYIFSLIIRKQRASLTVDDEDGRTVLQFAIQYHKGDHNCRRLNVIRQLLQEGANPNHRDVGGRTSLHYCIQSYRPDEETEEIMKCLLEHGGDPLFVNKKNKSAVEVISDTIPRLRTFVCIRDKFEIPATMLQIAQWKVLRSSTSTNNITDSDWRYITNMFLEAWGYDVFFSGEKTKILHLACKYCNIRIAFILFKLIVQIDILDADGKTPLQHLLTSDVIRREQKMNEFINKCDTYYEKLENLEMFGSLTMKHAVLLLQGLLEKSADPNIRDDKGNTPLHLLLTSGWNGKYLWDAARLLLKYGAKVNAVNNKGVTPLMLAAGHKQIEIRAVLVYILMQQGACAFVRDADKHDALWYSERNICEYVRVSTPNMSIESMCDSTEIGQAIMNAFEMSMPTSVHTDELCFGEHRHEWL